MPKTDIDYSNTIIYKITCNDTNVSDLYVGHTTNFVERKRAHRHNSINNKSSNYSCKLYEVIRNNGGWYNWKMSIVNFFDCKDQYEARVKEQEYFVSLNATLNSIEPMPTPKTKVKTVKVEEKEKQTFYCEKCNYTSNKKYQWVKHMNYNKRYNLDTNYCIENNADIFICKKCSKKFKHTSSLYRHKKTCITTEKQEDSQNDNKYNELLNYIVKENQDFKKQILEIINNKHNS
jgi:hypothetical protein